MDSAEQNADRQRFPYHRRFVRHKLRLKVEVKDDEGFSTWTQNLSEDGICFEIPRRLSLGREVIVQIYAPGGQKNSPLPIRCRVVWHDKGSKGVVHGGQFLAIEPEARQALLSLLAGMNRVR